MGIQTHDNYVYCWLYAQFQSRITTQRYSGITFSKPLFRGHRLERARQFRLSSSLTGDAMSKKLKLKLKNKRMSFCDILITIYSHQFIFSLLRLCIKTEVLCVCLFQKK